MKASKALVAGGAVALFWHRTNWQGEALRDDLEEVYRRLVPDLFAKAPGFPGLTQTRSDSEQAAEIRDSPLFTDVAIRTYPWSATLTTDGFVDLLLTQSDHRLLDSGRRRILIEAVRKVSDAHDGRVELPHATFLILARKS